MMKNIKPVFRVVCALSYPPIYYSIVSNLNKYVISRSTKYQDTFVFFASAYMTLQELYKKLHELYPDRNIGIITDQEQIYLNKVVDVEKQLIDLGKFKYIPIFQLLLFNRLNIYERDNNNKIMRFYGMKIQQHSLSNKINVPRYVQQGLLKMNLRWKIGHSLVGNIFSFKEKIPVMTKSENDQLWARSQLEEKTLQQSIFQLVRRYNYNDEDNLFLPKTNNYIKYILRLMQFNWIFQFVITFFGFGWKVGQPLSLMTNLLLVMLAIYQSNTFYKVDLDEEKKKFSQILNQQINIKMEKLRISYLVQRTLI